MIKRNKIKLIISSLIILLPTLIAIFGEKFLPEKIAIHWGFSGNADGFASPSSIFIILPLILLAVHWLCILVEAVVNKNNEQNKKLTEIVLWVIPTISIASSGMMLAAALGYKTSNIFAIVYLLLGLMFIIIGNYMPKATRNLTVGIKIKWALANDENWNATHRFSGKIYVVSGFVFIAAMLLPEAAFPVVAISAILLAVIPPVIYSYAFYKKQLREGKVTKKDYENGFGEIVSPKDKKIAIVISIIITVLLAIFFPWLMFTGNVNATLDDTSLNIEASFASDLTVKYENIDEIEYRESGVSGTRVVGFASARLLTGSFQNDEFGVYTRYTHTGNKPCIVIKSGEEILVLGLEGAEQTKALYEQLAAKILE